MSKSNKFSPGVRERAVRMVQEQRGEYDNALAETINGLYKAELIHRRAPWKTREAVEFATLEWVSGSTTNACVTDRPKGATECSP